MDIIRRLPDDIAKRMFLYFRHPCAEMLIREKREMLLEDIRDFPVSLAVLYEICGRGCFFLLEILWRYINIWGHYRMWCRLYGFTTEKQVKRWVIDWYAVQHAEYQIRSLWGLLTKKERWMFLNEILGQN